MTFKIQRQFWRGFTWGFVAATFVICARWAWGPCAF